MAERFDVAIVGAGILGLAHSYQLARRGVRVVVLERNPRAVGASIRNFGMLWPIGQPPGALFDLAQRSRGHWLTVLRNSGLWHEETGSLHLAYHADELAVLEEFAAQARAEGIEIELINPAAVLARAPLVEPDGLRGALWSRWETCVDPRLVIAGLPKWLAETYDVTFKFGCAVSAFEHPVVHSSAGEVVADRLLVCPGDDLRTLYPEHLTHAGLSLCKLQMMRSAPRPQPRIGAMLAGGLTLGHYRAFASCTSLRPLLSRFEREFPAYKRYGIHVMVSQHGSGELTIGDSHVYDDEVGPFDAADIDDLILQYLRTFIRLPDLHIASRWHGTYVKHPSAPYIVEQPDARVTIVTGVGGAGMTLSFGLAEQVVTEYLHA